MFYIAQLSVIMADRLKIVTIRARHGHKRLRTTTPLSSLLSQERDSVVFWMRRGAVLLKHKQEVKVI